MAGIVATSLTTNNASTTAADSSISGYVAGERITLTTTPTGTSYAWTLSSPGGSERASLNDDDAASVSFVPDVDGYYVVTCTVSGVTVYVLRIAVAVVGTVGVISALRFAPLADTQVPTPALGVTLYYSTTQSSLAVKLTNGSVETIDSTAV
jgi:hypothetical protein